MDGKKIDQDPMHMPNWSLGMAIAWIARRNVEGATELWRESLGAALIDEDDRTGLNRQFSEAETALKNTLTEGNVSATGLLSNGARIVVPKLEWEDMAFSYGMDTEGNLVHRATNKAGAMYTELRVNRAEILERWPAKQTAGPAERRRGPKTGVRESVKSQMIAYNNAKGDLAAMTEEAMASQFDASRDTCRKARKEVLSEFADE